MLLDDDSMTYKPTVFFNDFWLMRKHLVPVNETVTELPLHLSLSGMGNWKFMLYVQMDQSFNMQVRDAVKPPSLVTITPRSLDGNTVCFTCQYYSRVGGIGVHCLSATQQDRLLVATQSR